MASIAGNQTWDARMLKFSAPALSAWTTASAIMELWFPTHSKKHYLFSGLAMASCTALLRRIKNANIGASGFYFQQTQMAANAQHIAYEL